MTSPTEQTGSVRSGLTSFPWHPLLFGTAHVFAAYLDNAVSVVVVARPLAVVVTLVIGLTLVLAAVTRSVQRAAIGTTLLLLLLRSTPPTFGLTVAVTAASVGFVTLGLRWRRIPDGAAFVTSALNTVAVVLVLVLVTTLAVRGRMPELLTDVGDVLASANRSSNGTPGAQPASPADVYVLMLDGYPRSDTLARLFEFDNRPFLDQLRARGFDVAEASRSNYMYTSLTLTSVLHMRHIEEIPGIDGEDSLRQVMNRNPVFDEFRQRGYAVTTTSSGWETEALRSADSFCAGGEMSDFELNLVGPTVAGRLLEVAVPEFVSARDRLSVQASLECVVQLANGEGERPRFVFAHVPSPHLPIVFEADGSPAPRRVYGHTRQELGLSRTDFNAAYTAQLSYLNRRVLEIVDSIRASAPEPPVIVIFSDHGSESDLDWENALRSDMEERLNNLFAASTPGAPDLFGDAPTPVNLFPTLFNHYFGTNLPLSHNGSYVSTVQDRLGLAPAPPPGDGRG